MSLQNRGERIKMCLLNPWSVVNKSTELCHFIIDNDLDVLALTETWLSGNLSDGPTLSNLLPPGYQILHEPRGSRGGGTAVIHRSCLPMKRFHSQASHNSFELLECTLSLSASIKLCLIYRPERTRQQCDGVSFLEEFAEYLSCVVTSPGEPILMGDFNFHVDDSANPRANAFLQLLSDFGLKQHISQPTHRNGHILDLVISGSESSLITNCVPQDHCFPDHFPVFIDLSLEKANTKKKLVQYRKIKAISESSLTDAISSAPLLQEVADIADPDRLTEQYNTGLKLVLDQLAPVKARVITERQHCAWYTDELRAAKQRRRAAERTWRKSGLHVHREIFVAERNAVTAIADREKARYYSEVITAHKDDSKQLYRLASSLLDGHSEQPLPSKDPLEAANMFSEFFTSKITDIQASFPQSQNITIDIAQPAAEQLAHFKVLDAVGLRKLMSRSATKHCDLDPMPTHLMKSAINQLTPICLAVINSSLQLGHVPVSFKHALVSPRLKKPSLDKEEAKNYRPVSNLPFLSKVLERAVADQVMDHLSRNGLHEIFQSAYRPHHSTETALIRVHDDITRAITQGKVVLLVMIDLSAAFDTVDHQLLLSSLSGMGITGVALQWFSSYLSGRSQTVAVKDAHSESKVLDCGVPQGSVLGPILFNLYTASLGRLLHNCGVKYHMYADDTQVYLSAPPAELTNAISAMEACIGRVRTWMTDHRLKMNDAKTEVLYLSTKHTDAAFVQEPIIINNHRIESSRSVRDIGVTLDRHLNMETHVGLMCRNAYLQLRRLATLRRYMDSATLEHLVHAFVTSRLDYGNGLLCGLPQTQIARLQRVQNSAARILTGTRRTDHITPVLHSLHWLPVAARIKYKVLLMTFKCVNNIAPSYLCELVNPYVPNRDLRSDNLCLLRVPFTSSHRCASSSFSHVAPSLWNQLPLCIRNIDSISVFKSRLKTFLFTQQFGL